MDTIMVESIVSGRDKQPYVQLFWKDLKAQLTVEEARQHALRILEAADAAESDAFVVDFLMTKIGVDEGAAAAVLRDFREYRLKLYKGDAPVV